MNAYGSRFNVRVKPFDDRRVRQALNYALDKQHTVKLLNGAAVASHGLLPPGMFGRDDTIPPYPHDPAKARALLTEAGYPDGFDAEYLVMNDEEAEKLAGSLRDDLAEVGVRIHIVVESFTTYLTEIGSPDGAAFSKATWIGDYPDPENFLDVRFHSRMIAKQSSNNDTFYANPELDDLLDRARSETDVARRAELYRRAERVLYDDAPWIWDYHQQMTEVTQPYVLGYAPHPVWQRDYTSAWLDLGANGEPVRR
jgi:ABC-type transport system substrate-binding protein